MARVRSNTEKADSVPSAALIEIARLLARQAAREWAEQQPEAISRKPPRHSEKPL